MELQRKLDLVEHSLTRAAEQVGDITPRVMDLFYERYPQALEAFEHHARGNRPKLEAEMVDQALYCLMYTLSSPGEVEIMLAGSVVHHMDTLDVDCRWYGGLLGAAADVIEATIPAAESDERQVWQALSANLSQIISDNSRFALSKSPQNSPIMA